MSPVVTHATRQTHTVAQALHDSARRWPAHAFVQVLPETARVYGIDPVVISYQTASEHIARLREAYAHAGYGHGHRVGLLLDNRPAFLLHWLALNALGVSVVPINSELRAAELEYLIAHSEIVLAVAIASRHDSLHKAAQAAGCVLNIMADDQDPPTALRPAPLATSAITSASECALLYTSGTTGRPKGCMLSNRYFLLASQWYADLGGHVRLQNGCERMLTPLPLVHMNAMAYSVVAMIVTGGTIILLDRFHPDTWWDSVRVSRASVVHYLGVMPAMLMKAAPSPADRQHEVRFGFGAGVNRSLHEPFETRFGFPLIEAWAMTETGAGASIIAAEEPRQVGTNCFGREGPDVEVRLINEAGQDAGIDEPGELLVRHTGPDPRDGFFSGYLKDEAATREAWADGWFHTGDVVRRDAQGYLHFIDRRKNVIRRSGENIAAVEVESVLVQHPLVKAAAVAPTPDPIRGDEVLACIVAAQPLGSAQIQEATAHELVAWCLSRLAYYKAPGYVAFVDALPLTSSQKVQRGELKTLAARLPGQPHCVDTRTLKKRQAA